MLRSLYRTFLCITCFFCLPVVFGQGIENRFTHYTSKDGLSDGAIVSIIQDKDGFLWIGDKGALQRFDGHDFKIFRYDARDTNTLRENSVVSFFIDASQRLWMVTPHWVHLYHPDGEWFEHFHITTLASDVLYRVCSEENGNLIISGSNSLYKFDTRRKQFSFFDYGCGIKKGGYDYKRDEDGVIWTGSDQQLTRYDPRTKKETAIAEAGGTIYLLPGGYLLTMNYGYGLHLLNTKTMECKQFWPDSVHKSGQENIIFTSCKLSDSTFLIGTMDGLVLFNLRSGSFAFIKPDPLNSSSMLDHDRLVTSIYRDKEGIIWVGGAHLEKYDFTDLNIKIISGTGKDHHMKPFRNFFTLYRCNNGSFLLGDYSGAAYYNPATDSLVRFPNKALNGRIAHNFTDDGHGRIWCNTVDMTSHFLPRICAFDFDGRTATNINEYPVPIERGVKDMKLDAKGNVYKTSRRGLVRFDTTRKTFSFIGDSSLPQYRFTNLVTNVICVARNGSVWAGTQNGLNKVQTDGTIKQFSDNKNNTLPLPDWYINDMVEDSRGVIWFAASDHGIGRVDPYNDSISFISVRDGLPTASYDKLCVDDTGNLWAASSMGVLRMNTLTLQNQLYTEAEGFPDPDELEDMHYSRFNKRLYLLTGYSIFEIDPKSKNYRPDIPETRIIGLSVFDRQRPLRTGDHVNLNYNENFINIQFVCLRFHNARQIKYAYKMVGIDDNWVFCNFKRNASYTNLPPGHYSFMVRAQGPEGMWNEPTILSVVIRPPFWQTWWFYLAELAAATALIIFLVRLYTGRKLARQKMALEKLRAVAEERARIASDMHDDLGSGLTSIRLLSEIANLKAGSDNTAKTEIAKIASSANTLSEHLREIIWSMNTKNDTLEDFIIYVRSYAVSYFDDTLISFQFHRPDIIPQITLSGELRRNIFLCIKEALNNIVKHSQATDASLSFNIIQNQLVVEIKDNGIGFDTTVVNRSGNGLYTMSERLKKFGSSIAIDVKNGTTLVFRIGLGEV